MRRLALILAMAMVVASCGSSSEIEITDAWPDDVVGRVVGPQGVAGVEVAA